MLLVDDRQSQRVELDRRLHERMGSDRQVSVSRREGREGFPPRLRSLAAGQRDDPETGPGEERPQGQVVLLGEELGRGHERDLQAVLEGHEGGKEGDDCLAAPHVALQEPVHGVGAAQVADDRAHRSPLPGGQPERQHREGRAADAIVHPDGVRLAFPGPRPPAHLQAQAEEKQLFQNQPHLSRGAEAIELGERGAGGRKMGLPEGSAALGQPPARQEAGGQGIVEVGRQLRERAVDQPPKLPGRQGAHPFINRHDASAVQRAGLPRIVRPVPVCRLVLIAAAVAEPLVLGVGQPQAAGFPPLRRAVQQDPLPRRERRLQVRLVHPHRAKRARVVPQQHLEQREAAAAGLPQPGADHPATDRGGLARPQGAGANEAAAVFVAEGKPMEEIVRRAQARPLELGRPAGTDSLQETQPDAKARTGRRGRLRTHHGPSRSGLIAR